MKSIRANSVPQGGAANPFVDPGQGSMLLPSTQTLKAMADVFFGNSEQNYLQQNEERLVPGGQTHFRVQNVGLGESLELYVNGSFQLNNPSGATVMVGLAPEFPFNVISNFNLVFNGKVTLFNCDGYQLLNLMLKRNFRNMFVSLAGRIDDRVARVAVTAPATLAGAAQGVSLTGFSAISVPAGATTTVSFEMYIEVPFTLRKDIPLGLLPMNHNAVHAAATITTRGLIGNTQESPLFAAGAVVLTGTPDIRVLPTYNFWGLPANPALYNFFTNNSYVITTLPRNPIASVGERALAFNFPLNYWLVSSLFTIRDLNGTLVNIRNSVNFPHVVYNGTVAVDRSEIRTRIAREILATGRQYPLGCLFFDGAQTNALDGNTANDSKWLNMYLANNPAFYAHIAGIATPGSYDVMLEQIVPNHVSVL